MKKNIRHIRSAAIGALAVALGGQYAQAQSQDALLDKLVSKGVLSQKEAEDLREEADDGFRKSYQAKSGMPDWVTSMKMNGDFRGRYDGLFTDKAANRNRWRYRLRYGITANLLDSIEVGFRLGSGDATASGGFIDPISNNQTLDNNGAKKGIFLDLAYAKWSPVNTADWQMSVTVGKMENPFVTSDMMFDHDYTPEGVSAQAKYSFSAKHSLRLIGGAFVMDELAGSSRDPHMVAAQLRFDSTWDQKQKWQSTIGLGMFSLGHTESLTNGAFANLNVGNTRLTAPGTNPLAEGMDTMVADAAVTYTLDSFPKYPGKFPIKLAGEFLHNTAASEAEDGYSMGLTLGKSGKRKTWEVGYRWKELQGNAWFEELVDSDSGAFYTSGFSNSGLGGGYRAGTNLRGHVIKAAYSPYDSFTMGLTYFSLEAISENPVGSGSRIGRLQVDAVLKF